MLINELPVELLDKILTKIVCARDFNSIKLANKLFYATANKLVLLKHHLIPTFLCHRISVEAEGTPKSIVVHINQRFLTTYNAQVFERCVTTKTTYFNIKMDAYVNAANILHVLSAEESFTLLPRLHITNLCFDVL